MKTFKRFPAILIAIFMMVSMMVIPASAAGEYSVTITNTNEKHTYNVYQIFSGDLHDGILSNIAWGTGVTADGQTAMGVASSKASSLSTEAHAREFANLLVTSGYLQTPVASGTPTGTTFTATGLNAGYYLITDTIANSLEAEATSQYIVQILGNISMQPKAGVPTIHKTVSRDNISYGEGTSVSIGDTVYYKITAKLHDYVNTYSKYYVRFEDVIPNGIAYNTANSFVGLYVENGTTKSEVDDTYYSVDYTGNQLTVTVPNIHAAILDATGSATKVADELVVYYKATLDTDATIGIPGEENVAKLYYSNNPNEAYSGTGTPAQLGVTKQDVATVYTYELALKKVDATNNTQVLEGASFVIYVKEDGSETKKYMTFDASGTLSGYTYSESEATKVTTDATGMLSVSGLGRGTYWLHEVVAPGGYNLLESDISVTFAGSIDGNTGKLSSITASQHGGNSVEVELNGSNIPTGLITVTVGNQKGATLPTTGGIGTTIFYGIGGVLVLGALSLLIVRKRTTAK